MGDFNEATEVEAILRARNLLRSDFKPTPEHKEMAQQLKYEVEHTTCVMLVDGTLQVILPPLLTPKHSHDDVIIDVCHSPEPN